MTTPSIIIRRLHHHQRLHIPQYHFRNKRGKHMSVAKAGGADGTQSCPWVGLTHGFSGVLLKMEVGIRKGAWQGPEGTLLIYDH